MDIRRKRQMRYSLVFGMLLLAFCIIVVLNINTGNVQISVPEILKILFLKKVGKWSTISYGKFACRVFSWRLF